VSAKQEQKMFFSPFFLPLFAALFFGLSFVDADVPH